jgi:hypothetical protein
MGPFKIHNYLSNHGAIFSNINNCPWLFSVRGKGIKVEIMDIEMAAHLVNDWLA